MATEIRIKVPSDDVEVVSTLALFIGHSIGEFSHGDEAEGIDLLDYSVHKVAD